MSFSLEGPLELMTHCHCSRCRKHHGVAFATYAMAEEEGFRFESADDLVRYESSPGFVRAFCGRCGSVAPGEPREGRMYVPAGLLDGDPGIRPAAHIFDASKAPWYEIPDDLPRFDAFPGGIDAPVLDDLPDTGPQSALAKVVEGAPREQLRDPACERVRVAGRGVPGGIGHGAASFNSRTARAASPRAGLEAAHAERQCAGRRPCATQRPSS